MAEISYRRHRFPPVIIQHAVWVYLRFTLSYRDVEELLAERGLDISYETVRCWVLKFTDLELVLYGSWLTPRWRELDSNFRFLELSRAFFTPLRSLEPQRARKLVLSYRNPVLTDSNLTAGLSLWRGSWMLASVSP